MSIRTILIAGAAMSGLATSVHANQAVSASFNPIAASNVVWTKSASGTGGTLGLTGPIDGTLDISLRDSGGGVVLDLVGVQSS